MSLYDRLPNYLLDKLHMVYTVTFTVLFSVVGVLFSQPFLDTGWFEISISYLSGYTVLFFAIALAVVVVSRRVMYVSRNKIQITYLYYILWILAEVVVISAIYTFLTSELYLNGLLGGDTPAFDRVFWRTVLYTLVCIGVPSVVAGQYFAIQDRDNTIRLMNYGNVVSDYEPHPQDEKKITLLDNDGNLKFSVSQKNLYYIESDDNYVKVWYSDSKGSIKQYMLRCRLKTIEDSFSDSDLVRCHRKYVINISKVRFLSREKDGYMADLGLDNVDPIPVSKTYEELMLLRYNSR